MKKLDYLEGMRALMAINVILCHFVCVYYPNMYFVDYLNPSVEELSVFAATPLSVLVNGNIAVAFFFALTGFLVGMSSFTKSQTMKDVEYKVFKRYTRLLPVIIVATLCTALMMLLHYNLHLLIDNPYVNTDFLSIYCNFTPSITSVIGNILWNPFFVSSDYIGPFWTIKYEFYGYIITLVVAVILKESKWRRIWYIVIAMVYIRFADSKYAIFLMGLFVADLVFNQTPTVFNRLYDRWITGKPALVICFLASMYFSCCPMYAEAKGYSMLLRIPYINSELVRGFGISLFIFFMVNSKTVQKILSVKPLVYLGKMSFETYALHWPIMLSFEAGLFLLLDKVFSYHTATLLAFVLTIPVIYLSAIMMNIFIKKATHLISFLKKETISRAKMLKRAK